DGTTSLASVFSPTANLSMRAAHNTCVPLSSSATNRSLGKALKPRLEGGLPKAFSLSAVSATSKLLPSKLTNCHCLYQAPLVRGWAIGSTTASYSFCTASTPRRLRACEMPLLPATFTLAEGSSSHCTPSSRQRSTSREDDRIYSASAMT